MLPKDNGAHVVAPFGPVSLAGIETPYGELNDLAHQQNWNYAVFGTSHFKRFIRGFEKGVQARFGSSEKPIKNLTVVCHSMASLPPPGGNGTTSVMVFDG